MAIRRYQTTVISHDVSSNGAIKPQKSVAGTSLPLSCRRSDSDCLFRSCLSFHPLQTSLLLFLPLLHACVSRRAPLPAFPAFSCVSVSRTHGRHNLGRACPYDGADLPKNPPVSCLLPVPLCFSSKSTARADNHVSSSCQSLCLSSASVSLFFLLHLILLGPKLACSEDALIPWSKDLPDPPLTDVLLRTSTHDMHAYLETSTQCNTGRTLLWTTCLVTAAHAQLANHIFCSFVCQLRLIR
jgi:hypothetical protein